jgi:hypothetical protein
VVSLPVACLFQYNFYHKKNPVNAMFDGIERLRYDHDIQFVVKRDAFISMGSKMYITASKIHPEREYFSGH